MMNEVIEAVDQSIVIGIQIHTRDRRLQYGEEKVLIELEDRGLRHRMKVEGVDLAENETMYDEDGILLQDHHPQNQDADHQIDASPIQPLGMTAGMVDKTTGAMIVVVIEEETIVALLFQMG
jgi:hypothetical protein